MKLPNYNYTLRLDEILGQQVPVYLDNCVITNIKTGSVGDQAPDCDISKRLYCVKKPRELPLRLIKRATKYIDSINDLIINKNQINITSSIQDEFGSFSDHILGVYNHLTKKFRKSKKGKFMVGLESLVDSTQDLYKNMHMANNFFSDKEHGLINDLINYIQLNNLHISSDGKYVKKNRPVLESTNFVDAELVASAIIYSVVVGSNSSIILSSDMDVINISRNLNITNGFKDVKVYFPDFNDIPNNITESIFYPVSDIKYCNDNFKLKNKVV